jgi:D-proline reductase (dithiol) PrdB
MDAYRFLDGVAKRAMLRWTNFPTPGPIPWTPLAKPLAESRIAIVSSAAISLTGQAPFDLEIENRDPWFSDPSFRVLPRDTRSGDVRISNRHINPSFALQDLNCVMPLELLAGLAAAGEIRDSAPSHYSFAGFTLRPERLLRETVPQIVQCMKEEEVEAALLVPV